MGKKILDPIIYFFIVLFVEYTVVNMFSVNQPHLFIIFYGRIINISREQKQFQWVEMEPGIDSGFLQKAHERPG